MLGHAVGCFPGDGEHGRMHRAVAVLDVVRSERAVELVLCDAVAVLARVPERALVEIGRPSTADVKHDQTDGPSDGRVGAISRSESILAAGHANFRCERSVA